MNNFTFYSPTKVVFGKGTQCEVGAHLKSFGAKKVLVHYGSDRVISTGLMAQVTGSIKAAGMDSVMMGGVVPNPRLSLVREGAKLVKSEGVDFILAVGGGSVIDSAKGIAMAASNSADVWDFYTGKAQPQAALPTANILTLAAAGSETSEHTVLTNEDGWIKLGYAHELLRPKFTIMNPEMLFTLPPYQTASGVTDIMMHTLDRYFSGDGKCELTDRFAEELLKVTMYYGTKCMANPQDYEARAEVMWAGSISHNDMTGLGRGADWSPHKLEHELSGKFDVTHGAGLAAVWATWARYVYKTDALRFARYGVNVFGLPLDCSNIENTALEAIRCTEAYFESIDMPVTITALIGKQISQADIDDMADKCTQYGKKTIGGMQALTRSDVAKIYELAK